MNAVIQNFKKIFLMFYLGLKN